MASDDSDFYGDGEVVERLKAQVSDFDAEAWIQQHQETPDRPRKREVPNPNGSKLHNPYAGVAYAWQLTESLDFFLDRLPPATTDQTPDLPWIYICNPYIPRIEKSQAQSQLSRGNEDEAPEEEGSRTQLVAEGGLERLQLVTSFMDKAKLSNKRQSAVEREIREESRRATQDILDLAHAGKVRAGKWMLFCTPDQVNEIWEVVARATANNELGIAAKVAPRPANEDARKDRLICVYTADFRDKADVGRVLQKLRELRLVEARGRPIYYKPDAYTYIGISSGNSWGIRASIYGSNDAFP